MSTHIRETKIFLYHSYLSPKDMNRDMLHVTYFLVYGRHNLYLQIAQMISIEDNICGDYFGTSLSMCWDLQGVFFFLVLCVVFWVLPSTCFMMFVLSIADL